MPVQLPSGSVRKALSLDLNPGNFNRMVSIRGITGNKYLGAYAVRSAADFKWGEKGKYGSRNRAHRLRIFLQFLRKP